MRDEFQSAYRNLAAWSARAKSLGWLDDSDAAALREIEDKTADDLFAGQEVRPLVIGLFGGTGAGKSSLLNRLAGEPLARVGVERPTSREVTLYLHEDFPIHGVPVEFPKERTRTAYHRDPRRRFVAWLDMPDIDSTETRNRELAFAWLPYVDWLVYVVSPERYRDDVGWQVLERRGHRHAWLFVMNQNDRAEPGQLEDFRAQLIAAGLEDPTVLATQCVDPSGRDDFARLEAEINAAIAHHGLSELQRVNLAARMRDLHQLAHRYGGRFDAQEWSSFQAGYRDRVAEGLRDLKDVLRWPLELTAQKFAGAKKSASLWRRLFDSVETPVPVDESLLAGLWTPAAGNHLADLATRLVVEAHAHGIPAAALERHLGGLDDHARQALGVEAQRRVVRAVAHPGSPAQRLLHRLAAGLTYLLPLGAIIWAGAHVVTRFYGATQGDEAFLGFGFLTHTVVLVGLAWLFAWLLKRMVKPSLVASVRKALQAALGDTIDQVAARLDSVSTGLDAERRKLQSALMAIATDTAQPGPRALPGLVFPGPDGTPAPPPRSQ